MADNILTRFPAITFSIIVGLSVLVLDWIAHITIWNEEVISYFLAKPITAGIIAFLAYKAFINVFSLEDGIIGYYLYYSVLFAGFHGLYYRVYELIYNIPLFTRVGDLHLGFIVLDATTKFGGILIGMFNGLLIHGGSFFIGLIIAKMVVGDD